MVELKQVTLSITDVPAKKVPNGMWFDVQHVLQAHGLHPESYQVIDALVQLVRHTSVEKGGRLERDGHIDHADIPDLMDAWYCTDCRRERFEPEHDDCYMREMKR